MINGIGAVEKVSILATPVLIHREFYDDVRVPKERSPPNPKAAVGSHEASPQALQEERPAYLQRLRALPPVYEEWTTDMPYQPIRALGPWLAPVIKVQFVITQTSILPENI
jgi:hypothetical protein